MPKGLGSSIARLRVTPKRRIHILDGDQTGGGHGPGRCISGKSEFPSTLTDDEIIQGIERIANDPKSYKGKVIPTKDKHAIIGEIEGVLTKVIVQPGSIREPIITAFPINVSLNP